MTFPCLLMIKPRFRERRESEAVGTLVSLFYPICRSNHKEKLGGSALPK